MSSVFLDTATIGKVPLENIDFKSQNLEEGTIIEASVEKCNEDGKVILNVDDSIKFKVDKSSVFLNEDGKVKFEVKALENGKTVLRQIKETAVYENAVKSESIVVSDLYLTEDNLKYAQFLKENGNSITAESIKALKEIKKSIDYISNNIDERSIEKLIKTGLDAGKLTPDALARFVYEVKNNSFSFSRVSDEEAEIKADEYIKAMKDEQSNIQNDKDAVSINEENKSYKTEDTLIDNKNTEIFEDNRENSKDIKTENNVSNKESKTEEKEEKTLDVKETVSDESRTEKFQENSEKIKSDENEKSELNNNYINKNKPASIIELENRIKAILSKNVYKDYSKNNSFKQNDKTETEVKNDVKSNTDSEIKSNNIENDIKSDIKANITEKENNIKNDIKVNDTESEIKENIKTENVEQNDKSHEINSKNGINDKNGYFKLDLKNNYYMLKNMANLYSHGYNDGIKDITNAFINSSNENILDYEQAVDKNNNVITDTESAITSEKVVIDTVDSTKVEKEVDLDNKQEIKEEEVKEETKPVDKEEVKKEEIKEEIKEETKPVDKEEIKEETADSEKTKVNNDEKIKISDEEKKAIIKNLIKADVPVTEKNIEIIYKFIKKFENIDNIDEKTALKVIKNNEEITFESIYIAEYTPDIKNEKESISDEDLKQLIPQIEKIFEREGIENNSENIRKAELFIKNEIPLTKESFEKLEFLQNIKQDFDDLLYKAAEGLKQDKKPEQAELINEEPTLDYKQELFSKYEDIINKIPKFTETTIQNVISKNELVSLDNLNKQFEDSNEYEYNEEIDIVTKEYSNISNDKSENENNNNENNNNENENNNISAEAITAKKQLAQIQLKLTTEAALRLSSTGIDINVMPVKQAVEELEKLEREIYESTLKTAGAEPISENVEKMENLYKKLESLAPSNITTNVYKEIINNEIEFNIDSIDNLVNQPGAEKVLYTLDALATIPMAKYGDSFQKALGDVPHILEINGIEVNEENINAAKILSRNEMDITNNNITEVKTVDLKMDKVYDTLHPMIAANMIKEGLNPAEMYIDDVLKYIKNFENDYGQDTRDKIASNILDMEKIDNITKEERDAVVAVYRMLSAIEKYDSAAIGVAVKSNVSLTLGNLMEAAKEYESTKKGGVNIEVDEKFGEAQKHIIPENNIIHSMKKAVERNNDERRNDDANRSFYDREDINKNQEELNSSETAFTEKQIEYVKMVFDEIIDYSKPEKILELVKSVPDFKSSSLEKTLSKLKNAVSERTDIDSRTVKEIIKQIKEMSDTSSSTVEWMNKNNIPVTMANLQIVSGLIKNPFKNGKEIEKLEKKISHIKGGLSKNIPSTALEELKNGKSLEEIIDDVSKDVDEIEKKVIETASENDIDLMLKQTNYIKRATKLQSELNKNSEGQYQFPVRLSDGSVTDVNMYVINGAKGNDTKTFMAFETQSLGIVQVKMEMKKDGVSLHIGAENKDAADTLKDYQNVLYSLIKDTGFEISDVSFYKQSDLNKSESNGTEKIFTGNFDENVKYFDNMYEIII